ncbi:MAG: hypothetical protein QM608_13960 [Caulobacter sp.]
MSIKLAAAPAGAAPGLRDGSFSFTAAPEGGRRNALAEGCNRTFRRARDLAAAV